MSLLHRLNRKSLFSAEIALRAACTAFRPRSGRPVDVFLCITDHFEPQHGRPLLETARHRLEDWLRRYPQVALRHRDADGRHPVHSFFYPWDECDEWELERLAALCAAGWGEIELHLHHRNDTDEGLRQKLRRALATYRRHGALSTWPDGRTAFGFIHGDWALDNSIPHYCGVDNELTVLQEEGCFADFTFPSWHQMSQPRQVNSIYYAEDDPWPKSYDRGVPATCGRVGKGLLMVQGPLVPYFLGPKPAVDDPELANYPGHRYAPKRMDRWVRAGLHVRGRPDRIFIKLHTHGCADRNRDLLLGKDLNALYSDAERRYNDDSRYRLHYVTARELFNVVRATELGVEGEINELRDWVLPPAGRGHRAEPALGVCVGER